MKFPSSIRWIRLQAVSGGVIEGLTEDMPEQAVEEPSGKSSCGETSNTACIKMLRKIKGIIFDFDGTLFDNKLFGFRLVAANPLDAIRIRNERIVRNYFSGRDFLTAENYYRAFFVGLGKICLQTPEKMKSWYFNKYMPRMVRVIKKYYRARPGLDLLLQRMDSPESPIKAAIYSDYPFLKERMEAVNLPYTEKIRLYSPESYGAQKPAVRPFLQIARDMFLSPEEVLVIGDREDTDGLGAFHAGMRFFCLETGNKRYHSLDPNRRKPEGEKLGPTLLMYAGAWDGLCSILKNRIG
ncbi:MAG: HAD family hydrolase [Treponema sp.]|nr:HAD family hydrolase [Treponema sp.]